MVSQPLCLQQQHSLILLVIGIVTIQPISLNMHHDNVFPSFTTTYNNQQMETLAVDAPDGKTCTASVGFIYLIWVMV